MPTNVNAFTPNSQDFSTSGSITIPIGLDAIVNWATNTGPRLSITTRACPHRHLTLRQRRRHRLALT